MAAGRAIVASDLPAIREVLDRRGQCRARRARRSRRAGGRHLRAWPTTRRSAHGSAGGARRPSRSTVGTGAPNGSRRSSRCSRRPDDFRPADCARPLSGCRGTLVAPSTRSTASAVRRAAVPTARPEASISICGPRTSSPSRRSIWTKRCTPTRGTSACRRRSSDRRSATTCCASSCGPRPGDLVVDLGCGSGRALVWNRDLGAETVGIDISPFFSEDARRGVPLLLGDLRRLPFADGTFTKAWSLDVLEHLSPDALRGMLDGSQPRARARRRAVRLHARPQERAGRRRPALDQPARARPRAPRPDRHAPGTPAQVRSSQSARRRARPRARRARVRLPHRAHHVLHADRRRLRREHPDAHGRARDGQARGRRLEPGVSRGRRRRAGHPRGADGSQGADRQQPGDLRRAARRCRSR